MAEKSGFFDAMLVDEQYDRVYNASDFAEYFATFIGNGVFISPTDQLKVVAKSGLTVTVKKGQAFVEGHWYTLDENMDITFSPNSATFPVNDVIVCELNKSTREIKVKKKEAVESILPIKTSTIHELVLASISLGVGVSTITDAMIVDRRPSNDYCGFVKGLVEQISAEALLTQLTAQFNEWFDGMKDQLTDDAAGSLQAQINSINESMQTIRSGTANPDNAVGKDGDIYIKIVG